MIIGLIIIYLLIGLSTAMLYQMFQYDKDVEATRYDRERDVCFFLIIALYPILIVAGSILLAYQKIDDWCYARALKRKEKKEENAIHTT